MIRSPIAVAAGLSWAVVLPSALEAQGIGEGGEPGVGTAVATLGIWAGDVWTAILDREGAREGRLAEDGLFQRFDNRMDHEYELDLRTGLFDAEDDVGWASVRNGLRLAGASISHPHVLNRMDWRQEIPVKEPVSVVARYRRERTLTARRDYPRVGVLWRRLAGSPWALEAALGVHFFKPAADLEVALSRVWAGGDGATWELELGAAALDALNDVIFVGLGVDEEEEEAHLDHEAAPFAGRLSFRRTSPGWIVELHGGTTNRSEVDVTFPSTGDPSFTLGERAWFAGTLVQANPTPRLSLAGHATVARADTERRSASPEGGGFSLREETRTVGVRQRYGVDDTWIMAAEVERVWRPEDRVPQDGAPIDHEDRSTFGLVELVRTPATGWTGRLAWAVLDREAGVLAPDLTASNQRLVVEGGHAFPSGFVVTAGLRWDLDAFGRNTFDGGHLRLAGRW